MESSLIIKIDVNGALRRIRLITPTLEELRGVLFALGAGFPTALRYTDDEGDIIQIENDDDIAEAFTTTGGKPLRLMANFPDVSVGVDVPTMPDSAPAAFTDGTVAVTTADTTVFSHALEVAPVPTASIPSGLPITPAVPVDRFVGLKQYYAMLLVFGVTRCILC